jgi:hypothetical protein
MTCSTTTADGSGVSDWLGAGGMAEELLRRAAEAPGWALPRKVIPLVKGRRGKPQRPPASRPSPST